MEAKKAFHPFFYATTSLPDWIVSIIAFLEVTDDQKIISLLSTTISSKDVVESSVMFNNILSSITDERERVKAIVASKAEEAQSLIEEISTFKKNNGTPEINSVQCGFVSQMRFFRATNR